MKQHVRETENGVYAQDSAAGTEVSLHFEVCDEDGLLDRCEFLVFEGGGDDPTASTMLSLNIAEAFLENALARLRSEKARHGRQKVWPTPASAYKSFRCPHCDKPHIDKGTFAVSPHRVHLCHGCDLLFQPFDEHTIGVEEKTPP